MIEPLPSDIFRTGQVLNNTYEIEGVLGRGGTGEVYRAVNQVTGRVFAIKALSARFSDNAEYLDLMRREEEMRSIIHDAVVRYNECSRTDSGHVVLVMDYIDGPSLAEAMKSRRMDPREILIVGHRIAEGLVVAHRHGIVHRDLSPDNIILRDGRAEKATLIDFGIAKDTAAGARTIVGNEFAGKYEYAAPEQLDGKADARSDLYALGATLLAAYRGETPWLGTTPGEIVRRKQSPLDIDRVPDPLKGLVETLAAPEPGKRPADAEATVALIGALLAPAGGKKRRDGEDRRPARRVPGETRGRRGALPLVLGLVLLAGLAVAGYIFRDAILGPSLETVAPFTLEASKASAGPSSLKGYAPSEESAISLRSAFAAAVGTEAEPTALTLASGAPTPTWGGDLAGLFGALAPLESWRLRVSDLDVQLTGITRDAASMAALEAALAAWDAGSALTLRSRIEAGPEVLSAATVTAALALLADCGPLEVRGDSFAIGDTVPVSGAVARSDDQAAIRAAVETVIGSRRLDLNTTVMNEELCTVRAILPRIGATDVSIWLGNGSDGSPNLTGVYTTGQNPVVEVQVPASITEGFLWVMIVDNTDKVYHIVPNINDTEQRLDRLGTVEGGVRRIRVLHALDGPGAEPGKLGIRVNAGDYGKSEVVAILSRTPLFDLRRPRDESVASLAQALKETLSGREDEILAMASRVIDARQ